MEAIAAPSENTTVTGCAQTCCQIGITAGIADIPVILGTDVKTGFVITNHPRQVQFLVEQLRFRVEQLRFRVAQVAALPDIRVVMCIAYRLAISANHMGVQYMIVLPAPMCTNAQLWDIVVDAVQYDRDNRSISPHTECKKFRAHHFFRDT